MQLVVPPCRDFVADVKMAHDVALMGFWAMKSILFQLLLHHFASFDWIKKVRGTHDSVAKMSSLVAGDLLLLLDVCWSSNLLAATFRHLCCFLASMVSMCSCILISVPRHIHVF